MAVEAGTNQDLTELDARRFVAGCGLHSHNERPAILRLRPLTENRGGE